MKEKLQIFQDYIKERGLRYTPERETIFKAICTHDGHFDVDELYLGLKKQNPDSVSKASIYRTLPLLIEAGMVREIYLENGHMHYEMCFGQPHHCHLRCVECRRVIDFFDQAVGQIEARVAKNHRFEPAGHKLEIFGVCPECRAKGLTGLRDEAE